MEDTKRLRGKIIHKLMEELESEKEPIRVMLSDMDYESRVQIVDRRVADGETYFAFKPPEGFEDVMAASVHRRIRFEFIGKDRVPHFFEAPEIHNLNGKMWVRYPAVIERKQRREYFRLDAPLGMKITLTQEATTGEMVVLNLSERGALVTFKRKEAVRMSVMEVGTELKDLCLVFSAKGEKLELQIEEAVVRIAKSDPQIGRHVYGLEFTGIDEQDRITLREFIYRFQRKILRRRGFLEE
jgi:c-di-GMP-binding flagellar brake protein YcgR